MQARPPGVPQSAFDRAAQLVLGLDLLGVDLDDHDAPELAELSDPDLIVVDHARIWALARREEARRRSITAARNAAAAELPATGPPAAAPAAAVSEAEPARSEAPREPMPARTASVLASTAATSFASTPPAAAPAPRSFGSAVAGSQSAPSPVPAKSPAQSFGAQTAGLPWADGPPTGSQTATPVASRPPAPVDIDLTVPPHSERRPSAAQVLTERPQPPAGSKIVRREEPVSAPVMIEMPTETAPYDDPLVSSRSLIARYEEIFWWAICFIALAILAWRQFG